MGKLKIKKSDVWIDMTPMSDVMVLLLTFFMLTSTFVKNEPVKVNQPMSVSEIKIPEKDVLNIIVDKSGKVNTMTASWGGLGVMWNKDVAYIFIRPQRYTKEFVDGSNITTPRNVTFTLNANRDVVWSSQVVTHVIG